MFDALSNTHNLEKLTVSRARIMREGSIGRGIGSRHFKVQRWFGDQVEATAKRKKALCQCRLASTRLLDYQDPKTKLG
jgi:hypothetical protein